jgi:DNA gyrase inhibitor GyrI
MKSGLKILEILLFVVVVGSVFTFTYHKEFSTETIDTLKVPMPVLYQVLEEQSHILQKKDLKYVQYVTQIDTKKTEFKWHLSENENGTAVNIKLTGKSKLFSYPKADVVNSYIKQEKGRILKEVQAKMDAYSIVNSGVKMLEIGNYIGIKVDCSWNEKDAKMDESLPAVLMYALQNQMERNGSLFTMYHAKDSIQKRIQFSSCYPIKSTFSSNDKVNFGILKNQKYHVTTLTGNYKYLEDAWAKAYQFLEKDGLKIVPNQPTLEVYRKGHTQSANPADWVTKLYIAVE